MKNGQKRDKTTKKREKKRNDRIIKTKKYGTARETDTHNDKMNGFQVYVEKMKHSLAAILKKKQKEQTGPMFKHS